MHMHVRYTCSAPESGGMHMYRCMYVYAYARAVYLQCSGERKSVSQ